MIKVQKNQGGYSPQTPQPTPIAQDPQATNNARSASAAGAQPRQMAPMNVENEGASDDDDYDDVICMP